MNNQFNDLNNQPRNWFSETSKKKLFFIGGIVFVLLLVIAAGAYYYFYYYQKPSAPAAPIFPSAPNGTNPFADIVVGQKPAAVDCTKEPTDIAKDTCWQSKAITEKNANFCKSIKESTTFVSRDACINLVAHEKKDKSLCASIQNLSIKKNCQEIVK